MQKRCIFIDSYCGDAEVIENLRSLINDNYSNLFLSVIVHGSIATDEICLYSDFDGLIIVKDEYKGAKELSTFLRKSLKIITRFDPLQHHGWFIIFKSQLQSYPQQYLPVEVLDFAKLIFPNKAIELTVNIQDSINYKSSYTHLTNAIRNKIISIHKLRTAFQLKSFLSQVLLLPAVYYSAKYTKGIDKKSSFEAVQSESNRDSWRSIEIASEIRKTWSYSISNFDRQCLNSRIKLIRIQSRSITSKKISKSHGELITSPIFIKSIISLLNDMDNEINRLP